VDVDGGKIVGGGHGGAFLAWLPPSNIAARRLASAPAGNAGLQAGTMAPSLQPRCNEADIGIGPRPVEIFPHRGGFIGLSLQLQAPRKPEQRPAVARLALQLPPIGLPRF